MTGTSLIASAEINEGAPQLGRRGTRYRNDGRDKKYETVCTDAFTKQRSFCHSYYLIFVRGQFLKRSPGNLLTLFTAEWTGVLKISRNLVKAVAATCHMLLKKGALGRNTFM